MFLDITQALRMPGEEVPFLHREQIPPQEIFGEIVTFDQVAMSGFCAILGSEFHLRGKLETTAHATCAGCLSPVAYPVSVDFDEDFTQLSHDEMRQAADDTERLAFEGSKVELSQLALTLVLLNLPIRFVCGDHCPVLDWEEPEDKDTHACQKELPDQHPFSALQQLLTKDQEV